jgi:mRNA-degrading endonuclease RelE of RelBE toxin-antitoxin system
MNFKVSASPTFERELKQLSKKYPSIKVDIIAFSKSLSENPFQGDGLGKDCYKVRMKVTSKGRGKSGGSRVITCVKIVNEQVKLLSIYDKSEQETISDSFLMQLLVESGLI